ncbi:hypothetical protein [Rhodococcus koreensis]
MCDDQKWDHEPTIGELGLCGGPPDESRPNPKPRRALDRGFMLVPDELADQAPDMFTEHGDNCPLILTFTEARTIARAIGSIR